MTSRTWSRREVLVTAALGITGSALLAACGAPGGEQATAHRIRLRSRPGLSPPKIAVTGPVGSPAPGFFFVTPEGPMIVGNDGTPLWYQPAKAATTNLRVQQLHGQPVLTWWEGQIILPDGYGRGECVLMDDHYREIRRVRPGNGLPGADPHEFFIDAGGVAFLTIYRMVDADLRQFHGPRDGRMLDTIVQGIDLGTDDVVFEWHSKDHVDLAETYATYSEEATFDPVHTNSVDVLDDGSLLLSARNTWALYKVDRANGSILWRLGGKRSDFVLGDDARFAWQHDARQQGSGTITLFDDEGDPKVGPQSRGLVLTVDEAAKKVTLDHAYLHPGEKLSAGSQGSMQFLPDGGVVVGWGAEPYYTEYRQGGSAVLDARIEEGASYRALKYPWTGRPTDRPAVAAQRSTSGFTAYASWNGATEVAVWQVLAGSGRRSLARVAAASRSGFETHIPVHGARGAALLAVRALDGAGNVLGTSEAIPV